MIIDFNKYINKREDTMEKTREKNEILSVIQDRKENGTKYKISQMKKIADKIVSDVGEQTGTVIPVIKIAEQAGFKVYPKKMKSNLSGCIEINESNRKKYGTDKIIFVNKSVNPFQQRFVIAHELAHYFFDYGHKEPIYYNTYKKNDHKKGAEQRANTFAANLLMPKHLFVEELDKAISINPNHIFVINYLSNVFKAPRKSVQKRINEVGGYKLVCDFKKFI